MSRSNSSSSARRLRHLCDHLAGCEAPPLAPSSLAGKMEPIPQWKKSEHASGVGSVDDQRAVAKIKRLREGKSPMFFPSDSGPREYSAASKREFLGYMYNFVSTFDGVKQALSQPSKVSAQRAFTSYLIELDPEIGQMFKQWLLAVDPPAHTRIRRVLNRGFTKKAVLGHTPSIQAHIKRIIDAVADRERKDMDLVHEIAFPLPCMVLSELLGLPLEHIESIKHWSEAVGEFLGGVDNLLDIEGRIRKYRTDLLDMKAYLQWYIDHFRRHPDPEALISILIQTVDDNKSEGVLTDDELIANCVFLMFAGHETTTNLIGSGILALLASPDQFALLKSKPKLIHGAIEEILRLHSPVQIVAQTIKQPLQMSEMCPAGQRLDRTVPPGELLLLELGKANRDPHRFSCPHKMDITRVASKHLAFSQGRHVCLGRNLARLEGSIVIGEILRRFEGLRLNIDVRDVSWKENVALKGLESLPVTWDRIVD